VTLGGFELEAVLLQLHLVLGEGEQGSSDLGEVAE
jgi:hypothetical protein